MMVYSRGNSRKRRQNACVNVGLVGGSLCLESSVCLRRREGGQPPSGEQRLHIEGLSMPVKKFTFYPEVSQSALKDFKQESTKFRFILRKITGIPRGSSGYDSAL